MFPALSSSPTATLVHTCTFIANCLDYWSSLYCRLPQVRLQPLNGVLGDYGQAYGRLVHNDWVHVHDTRSSSASGLGSPLSPDTTYTEMRQLILWSSLSWPRPTLVADLFAQPREATLWIYYNVPDGIGFSRLCFSQLEMTLIITRVFSRETSLAFLKLLQIFLFGRACHGSESPLNSYLEWAFHMPKLHK